MLAWLGKPYPLSSICPAKRADFVVCVCSSHVHTQFLCQLHTVVFEGLDSNRTGLMAIEAGLHARKRVIEKL